MPAFLSTVLRLGLQLVAVVGLTTATGAQAVVAQELPTATKGNVADPGAGPGGGAAVESLIDIYSLAVESDPQLRGQAHELDALREDRRERLAGLLPAVTFNGEINRTRREQVRAGALGSGQENITRTFTQEQFTLELRQPLLNLPAWHGLRQGQTEVDRGEAQLEAERQNLITRVVEAYLTVLSAQSAVVLSQHELEAIEGSFRRISAMHEEGFATITDLEDVTARRDRARAAVIRAAGDLEVALERLSEITGRDHRRLAMLRGDAELPSPEPDDIRAWVEAGLEQNPRIQAVRERVGSLGLEARASRAERYPTVNLVAGYTAFDDFDGTALGRELEDVFLGVRVNLPLYQGGAIGARSRGFEQRRSRARQELKAERRTVRTEVRSAFLGLRSGRSEIAALEQAVRSGERRVEAMEAGLEEGTRPVTDLLDAQSELFSARRELAEARFEYLANTVALRQAAGQVDGEDVARLDALFAPNHE